MIAHKTVIDLDLSITGENTKVAATLPDLDQILANISAKDKASKDAAIELIDTDDAQAFGHRLAQFGHVRQDGTIEQPVKLDAKPKKPRKPRIPKDTAPKEKKVRAPKVKKEPKKKFLTITERAMQAYAPEVAPVDQGIKKYVTSDGVPLTAKPTPTRKPKTIIASPRTVRSRYKSQKLVYCPNESAATAQDLGMSKLITMSRGLWNVSNRDAQGQTTDGGRSADPVSYIELEVVEPENDVPISINFDQELPPTQEYLKDLVAGSDISDAEDFPVDVPSLERVDTTETLRESLAAQDISPAQISIHSSDSRKRRSTEPDTPRHVIIKTTALASPHNAVHILDSDDSDQPLSTLKRKQTQTTSMPFIDLSQPAPEVLVVPDSEEDDDMTPIAPDYSTYTTQKLQVRIFASDTNSSLSWVNSGLNRQRTEQE